MISKQIKFRNLQPGIGGFCSMLRLIMLRYVGKEYQLKNVTYESLEWNFSSKCAFLDFTCSFSKMTTSKRFDCCQTNYHFLRNRKKCN